jgi:hypothetical protein
MSQQKPGGDLSFTAGLSLVFHRYDDSRLQITHVTSKTGVNGPFYRSN